MKKKILFLVLSIFIVALILFSSSYALLFKSNVTDKQSYTTGILDITSETLNGSVTLNNELPMTDSDGENTTPYIFRITNTGNLTYKFNIMLLSTTTDNQIEAEYIKIKVNDNIPVKLSDLTNGVILSDITLKPGKSIEVSLRVWLDENTPNSQIGKSFNAKVTTEGEAIYTNNNYAKETLVNLGLTENTDTPDFSKSSCSSGCGEATVGLFKTQDDFGDSYYFRGDVENNYVYFANKYWRIIRINGDGTVRMIYAGTSAHDNGYDDSSTNNMSIGTRTFNSLSNDNAYVGYMYGKINSNIYNETHSNTNNSTAKTTLDSWYNNNIKGTINEQYVTDAIYCNDREISLIDSNYTGNGSGSKKTLYKSSERLQINKTPTLKCNQVNDRFTTEIIVNGVEGNGALNYPIGLITADEATFAGGVYGIDNSKYYLYTNKLFWTMSPYNFGGADAYEFFIDSTGNLDSYSINSSFAVRPVISISGSALNSGTGTKTDPFKIDVINNNLKQLNLTETSGTPDFSKTSCSSGCVETTVGLFKTVDDFGDSYYFRGDVENNYVYFAGFYWRIIRINGDGSIRMIYDGTSAHNNGESSTDRVIASNTFNNSYTDNAYIGFKYGATGAITYAETHANTNDSAIKRVLDTWYTNNIKGTTNEQYITAAIYCNDRKVSTASSLYTGDGSGITETSYIAYERLYIYKRPTLQCSQVNDRFTKNATASGITGNGKLTNAIGLITADEVAYAGGNWNSVNSKYYLYTGNWYWTMSPANFDSNNAYEFYVGNTGILDKGNVNESGGVRPVISILGTALNSGTGTKTDPFKIN